MKKVLVTGSEGFIGRYIVSELLDNNYYVIGIDNFSKYGWRETSKHPNFEFHNHDLRDNVPYFPPFDYLIHTAAMIGGIKMFHERPADIISQNSLIDGVVLRETKRMSRLKKFIALSSSMVYENCSIFPSPETEAGKICPSSSYGFSKLALEYSVRAFYEQYGLPYIIARPFNCIGIGEDDYKELNSHVLPDFVYKALTLKPTDIFPILGNGKQIRHYTAGKDLARGIRLSMESNIINDDFNLSSSRSTTVKELATIIWRKIHGTDPLFACLPSFQYDVQKRIPDTSKAERLLGFKAEIPLEETIDEVIEYIRSKEHVVR